MGKLDIFIKMRCTHHGNRAVGSEGTKASRVAGTCSSYSNSRSQTTLRNADSSTRIVVLALPLVITQRIAAM